jgi:hypothetical protein
MVDELQEIAKITEMQRGLASRTIGGVGGAAPATL